MFHHSCTRKRLRFMDKRRLYKLSTGLITISLYIKKIRYKHHPNPAPAPPAQRPDAGKVPCYGSFLAANRAIGLPYPHPPTGEKFNE